MSLVSTDKLQNIYTDFLDTRLIPSAPSHIKWVLYGSVFLINSKVENFKNNYLPKLKSTGLVNENNQFDTELIKNFMDSAFNGCPKFEMFGIIFDKSDGEHLVSIMEKYKDV